MRGKHYYREQRKVIRGQMTDGQETAIDFDNEIDRAAAGALKFDGDTMQSLFGTTDLWPSWVADMDFAAAHPIQQALARRVRHGVYGYEAGSDAIPRAVADWYTRRHGWPLEPGHILFAPRTLTSIVALITQFSDPGDGVIVQSPVFYDFKLIVSNHGRRLVKNPLVLESGTYRMDFDQLEEVAARPANRLLILCNPHNPIGRVWPAQDLQRLAEICAANDVFIIADEIHGDICFRHDYTPLASLSSDIARNCATCISPVKSFNLAGVCNSMIVIADEDRRARCREWLSRLEINKNNVFATAATLTAYTQGEQWLEQVTGYLRGNIDALREFLQQRIPQVTLVEPEGSFLAWLDFRGLELEPRPLAEFLALEAGIASNPGHWFGREGAGFARINIACPRRVLLRALGRLEQAVANRQ